MRIAKTQDATVKPHRKLLIMGYCLDAARSVYQGYDTDLVDACLEICEGERATRGEVEEALSMSISQLMDELSRNGE